ncbi:hypothetical protein PUN28_008645 [Cardiocondyla obscurior]|uniref:Ribosomal protein S13 n=1 Tax=Cardiocondyla obscurior TaxID=286306 RepID=A0AAW2G1P1_9HYME
MSITTTYAVHIQRIARRSKALNLAELRIIGGIIDPPFETSDRRVDKIKLRKGSNDSNLISRLRSGMIATAGNQRGVRNIDPDNTKTSLRARFRVAQLEIRVPGLVSRRSLSTCSETRSNIIACRDALKIPR